VSVVGKPPEEWTDREIAIGLAEYAKSIQWYSDQHQPWMVDALHDIARNLADKRDRRRRLRRDVDEAMNPFQVVDTVDFVDDEAGDKETG
jgi:hypothetical protein